MHVIISRYGECVGQRQTKLTFDDVRNIRSSTLSDRELAGLYPVNTQQISRIKKRIAWKHVV